MAVIELKNSKWGKVMAVLMFDIQNCSENTLRCDLYCFTAASTSFPALFPSRYTHSYSYFSAVLSNEVNCNRIESWVYVVSQFCQSKITVFSTVSLRLPPHPLDGDQFAVEFW